MPFSSGGPYLNTDSPPQSSHPLALFFLYFFRIAAVVVYILSEWFTSNYVLTVSPLSPRCRVRTDRAI